MFPRGAVRPDAEASGYLFCAVLAVACPPASDHDDGAVMRGARKVEKQIPFGNDKKS
jgi:hypothetical protein